MKAATFADVSETARWVATYRARESARQDALFRDPYAARLSGARGSQLAHAGGRFSAMGNGWPIVTRTKLLDDLILRSIADGCTTVLNLAAGFDTRPYRLSLPPTLRWIEVDLPALLDEKEAALASETPRCELERVRLDLTSAAPRAELFDRVAASSSRVLVITEGLVLYLDEPTVRELGRELLARSTFSEWLLDFPSPAILRALQRGMGQRLVNAPMKFGPASGVAFFEALGWQARDVQSLLHEGARLRRVPWPLSLFAAFPPPNPRALGKQRWSGVVRLARPEDGHPRQAAAQ
jgi:methyltransferase (TIGR00027 family)